MSTTLPEGFEIQETPQPKGKVKAPPAVAPVEASTALPEGFELQPFKEKSVIPHMIDKFKEGAAAMGSFPGFVADLAINHGPMNASKPVDPMDGVSNVIKITQDLAGKGASKLRQLVGIDPKPTLSSLIVPDKPAAPAVSNLGEMSKKGLEAILDVKHIPIPTDAFGGKSKSNEYLSKISEFTGANLIPGGAAVRAAEKKLATLLVSQLQTTSAGMGAVEIRELGEKHAESFGLTKEEGGIVGEVLGSFMGPGGIGLMGQAVVKTRNGIKTVAKANDLHGTSKEAQKAAANSMLQKEMKEGLDHTLDGREQIERAIELKQQIPGFNPTVAQASDAPALVAMQREVSNKSGQTLGKAAAVERENQAALDAFKESKFPTQERVVVQPGQLPPGEVAAASEAGAASEAAAAAPKPSASAIVTRPSPTGPVVLRPDYENLVIPHDNLGRNVALKAARLQHQMEIAEANKILREAHKAGLPAPATKFTPAEGAAGEEAAASAAPKAASPAAAVAEEGAGPVLNRPYVIDPVLDPARAKLSANRSVTNLLIDKTNKAIADLSARFKRTVNNEEIGNQLRDKYWQARQLAKGEQDAAMADVYKTAKAQGVQEDMTDIQKMVKGIADSDKQTFQNMPSLFNKILSEYGPKAAPKAGIAAEIAPGALKATGRIVPAAKPNAGNGKASFEEVHSLYKEANKDWADAVAANDTVKAAYMQRIRGALKEKLAKYEGPEHGMLGEKFKAFNAGYKQYAETFKTGVGEEIARRGKSGISRDAEDIVTKTILKAGDKKKGVQDFFKIYGNDADAAKLLRDGLTDSFSKQTMRSGQFNPKAANAWLKQHEQAMNELPALRDRLRKAGDDAQMLVDRRKSLMGQRKMLDQTYLAKVAKSSNPEALISKALSDTKDGPKVLKALMVGAESEASKQSIARAIVDSVMSKGAGLDYLMQHEAALKPVLDQLGKGHWENLKTLSEAQAMANRIKAPKQVELSKLQDLGEKTVGTSVKSVLSKWMAAEQGRVSKPYVIADLAGRWLYKTRTKDLEQLREAAVFDPDLAGFLARMGKRTSAPTKEQLLDLKRLAYNVGVNAAVVAANGPEERKRQKEFDESNRH